LLPSETVSAGSKYIFMYLPKRELLELRKAKCYSDKRETRND
jgi:hypothetical protein